MHMYPKLTNTIICMTDDQVENIKLLFKQKIQKKSIQLPAIYSLNHWLKKEYKEFCMVGSIDESYRILNGIEEKLLWERIIHKGLDGKNFQKKQIDNITEKVISADRLIREYKIKNDELKKHETNIEKKEFNRWLNEFDSYCKQNKLLSRLKFIEFFIDKQMEHTLVDNKELMLIGFDNKSPLYEELFSVLNEKNNVEDYKVKQAEKIKRQEIKCEDVEGEIKEVTKWVKQNPKKKLLIISPALNRFQIKLQNELDRQVQPDIYNEYDKNNIYNSNLQRPLSNEPIITAAINLLKLNNTNQTSTKIFYESLLFNNWIDTDGYKDREELANYINDKKFPKISINSLIKLIKNDPHIKELNLDSLLKTLSLLKKNQILWSKNRAIDEWVNLTEQYWTEIKISKINNLLLFEINNINRLFNLLNQIKKNQIIDYSISFEEYWEILFTHLSNSPAPKDPNDSYVDINGFAENPMKKYDAIWLMNMNTKFWPGKAEFNPFLPQKLQKKYHIYDEVYIKKLDDVRMARLNNFSGDITISFSKKDGETELIQTPGYFEGKNINEVSNKTKKIENHNFEEIDDHKAPKILGDDVFVSGGFRALENYQKSPAWAFYENRLHANSFYEDKQDEISKMSRGNLVHELLERFWREHKNSINLSDMTVEVLKKNISTLTNEVMSDFKVSKPHLTPSQIQLESHYYNDLLYQWLSFEKTERPRFSVIESEKKYQIKIDRITFNVKIDRIDEYEDGSRLLIDYKTGAEVPISQWKKSPITSLQMPIYVAFTGIENVSAAGIAYIHNKNVKLVGLSSHGQDPIDGGLKDCSLLKKDEDQWQYLINEWRNNIYDLASGYLSGNAEVSFRKESELEYCAVRPLLRIAERRFLKEKDDE